MDITRRGVIGGAAIGGGLLVAWWALPRTYPNPLAPARGEHVLGAWLKVAEDGVVSVAVPQIEMGQGITTLIPQIVAEELGADWRQIAVEPAAAAAASVTSGALAAACANRSARRCSSCCPSSRSSAARLPPATKWGRAEST